jgi:hypothetical protein
MDDLTNAAARERMAARNARTEVGREKRGGVLQRVLTQQARIVEAMRESGIPIAEKHLQGERLRMYSILVEAERTIPDTEDLGFTLLWSIASTSAHGSLSAVEQISKPVGRAGEPIVIGDPEAIGDFASQAAHLMHAAHDSWNRYAGHV